MPKYLSSYTIKFFLDDITSIVNTKFDTPVEAIQIKKYFSDFNGCSNDVYLLIKHDGKIARWSLRTFLASALRYHKCVYILDKVYYNKPWWIPWGRKATGFKLKITKTEY